MSRLNGHDPERLQEKQHESQLHSQNIQAGQQQTATQEQGNPRAEYIQELTDTSLEDPTETLINQLVTQDFVLGQLSEADLHEIQYLLRELELEVVRAHPPRESDIQGEYRSELLDDDHEALSSLSTKQRIEIQQYIMGVFMRATRSLDGWQQEEWSKVYSVSEVKNDDESDPGFLERRFS